MMDIKDSREKIDEIDSELIRLVSERIGIASDIAAYKSENGLPVLDKEREKEKILAVLRETPDEYKDYMPILFEQIFELSRSYQNRLIGSGSELAGRINSSLVSTPKLLPDSASVACQGMKGANSQTASEKLFKYPSTMFFSTFEAVFTAVSSGLCKYGVIPLENSFAGSVNTVYDLMMKHNFYIVKSLRLKINHNLLVKPGTKLSDIREIYSHDQALEQCSAFLNKLSGVRVIPCANTAVAAQKVAESDDKSIAAIASDSSANIYGLEILEGCIQNVANNYTRFICISKDLEIYPGADRTSLMLTLPHTQGSLYKILSRINSLGVNLNKLESRPLPNKEFEFMFYFDLDASIYSPGLIQLISEFPSLCESFHYLGSYNEVF